MSGAHGRSPLRRVTAWEAALLTDEALYRRKWGWIPALGEILGKKEIPWHYFGPTSVSDNRFESTRRLIEIMILIRENCDEIRGEMTRSQELHEKCYLELAEVARALEAVGQDFLAQSQEVAELANNASPPDTSESARLPRLRRTSETYDNALLRASLLLAWYSATHGEIRDIPPGELMTLIWLANGVRRGSDDKKIDKLLALARDIRDNYLGIAD
jgi:hypothetical protein